jgi:hypothetical protein
MTKFTDYRLIMKFGFAYKLKRWRLGLNVTLPDIRAFSSGKTASRVDKRTNIYFGDVLLPDYVVFSGQSKSELKTHFKAPFSIAAGFIYERPNRDQKLYFSAEYFARIRGYKMVDAQIDSNITTPPVYQYVDNDDWLSFAYGSNPFLNVAIGYSWKLKQNLVFLNAFRTDFSAVNNLDLGDYQGYNIINTTTYNIYHYSAGLKFSIKNNNFQAGGDVAFGFRQNERQISNFANPLEFDPVDQRSLQGPLENTMNSHYFGFSIYIGATLNFIKEDDPEK